MGPQKRNKECYPWVTALQPAQPSPSRPLCKISTHQLFPNSDFFNFLPKLFDQPLTTQMLSTTCATFLWMAPIPPFPLSPSSPVAEWDQQSRQLTHIHTGMNQNPSPAPCAVAQHLQLPCTGGEHGDSRRRRAHVSRAWPRARSYFWSYFWRAASRGAEAAELRGTDRKRKALVFRTGREVSQPPAGKERVTSWQK